MNKYERHDVPNFTNQCGRDLTIAVGKSILCEVYSTEGYTADQNRDRIIAALQEHDDMVSLQAYHNWRLSSVTESYGDGLITRYTVYLLDEPTAANVWYSAPQDAIHDAAEWVRGQQ